MSPASNHGGQVLVGLLVLLLLDQVPVLQDGITLPHLAQPLVTQTEAAWLISACMLSRSP